MKISEWEPVLARLVSPKRDHIRGPLAAPVSLVEYGDYECPYCGAAQPIIDEIKQQMGERRRDFLELPLPDCSQPRRRRHSGCVEKTHHARKV